MDVKQIVAGSLNVGYIDAGPEDGTAVLLLHGWPYDIHSYVDVAPLLTAQGYRVIIPYLRGYGTTHFLSEETFRIGSPKLRTSPCPLSRSKATPTVRRIRSRMPTPRNSRAGIHTGRSRGASGTTFLRKLRNRLPKPLSMSTPTNEGGLMSETTTKPAPLTVALIHGAFADASSWNGVIERLQASGFRVTAPAIPLRGIACDSAYTASFLRQIPGPVLRSDIRTEGR